MTSAVGGVVSQQLLNQQRTSVDNIKREAAAEQAFIDRLEENTRRAAQEFNQDRPPPKYERRGQLVDQVA